MNRMIKKISLKNNKGQKIAGIFNIPKGSGPFPAVIICHGFKGYKEQGHLRTLATELARNGIAALRFDFGNGVGKSYGKMEDISLTQYLEDLKVVVDFISKQKFVDKKRLGLTGHSLGGQLVFHYAPADKRVKALVGLAGSYYRGKGRTGLEKKAISQMAEAKKTGYFFINSERTKKRYKIKIDFYFDLIKHDTIKQIKKIKIPSLLLHGSKDSSVRQSSSRDLYKLLKQPKKLIVIPGAPHTWRGQADPKGKFQKKINPIVADWFKEYL